MLKRSTKQTIRTIAWLAWSLTRMSGKTVSSRLYKTCFLSVFFVCYIGLVGISITTNLRDSAIQVLIRDTGNIVLKAPYATLNIEKINHILHQEVASLKSSTSYRYAYGCIENESNKMSTPIIFKITDSKKKGQGISTSSHLTLNKTLASRLHVHPNSMLSLHILNLCANTPIVETISSPPPPQDTFVESGSTFQEMTVLIDPKLTKAYDIPSDPTHIAITLTSDDKTSDTVAYLRKRLHPIEVLSWLDMFASLKEAIKTEKLIELCCIIILLSLSALCIYTCWQMIVYAHKTQRRQLVHWGFSKQNLIALYLMQGSLVSVTASLSAIGIGYATMYLLNFFQAYKMLHTAPETLGIFTLSWQHCGMISLSLLLITTFAVILAVHYSGDVEHDN